MKARLLSSEANGMVKVKKNHLKQKAVLLGYHVSSQEAIMIVCPCEPPPHHARSGGKNLKASGAYTQDFAKFVVGQIIEESEKVLGQVISGSEQHTLNLQGHLLFRLRQALSLASRQTSPAGFRCSYVGFSRHAYESEASEENFHEERCHAAA